MLASNFYELYQAGGSDVCRWESIYHKLACEEAEGLEELGSAIKEARASRHQTLFGTLVGMAEEQMLALSDAGGARVDFYRGLLALDSHQFDAAESTFNRIDPSLLPAGLAARLELNRGLILEIKQRWRRAEQLYRRLLKALGGSEADLEIRARLQTRLAEVYIGLGNLQRAERYARRSLKTNQDLGNTAGAATSYETLGRIATLLRDSKGAEIAFKDALAILAQMDAPLRRTQILSDLAESELSLGNVQEALACYTQAIRIKTEAGDTYGLGFIYSNIGRLCMKNNQVEQAIEHFRASLAIFRQFRDLESAAKVLWNTALAYEALGQPRLAAEQISEGLRGLPADSPWLQPLWREAWLLEQRFKQQRFKRLTEGALIVLAALAFILLVLVSWFIVFPQ